MEDYAQKFLHLSFRSDRVHAGEFQALVSVDPGVPDHRLAGFEKTLPNFKVDPIGIEMRVQRQVAEDDRAELRVGHEFESCFFPYGACGVLREGDGAVNH